MSDQPKTYAITTVTDFLKIPADRREIALREFKTWLSLCETVAPFVDEGVMDLPDEYVWVDDDLGECTVSLIDRASGEHLYEHVLPIPQEPRP